MSPISHNGDSEIKAAKNVVTELNTLHEEVQRIDTKLGVLARLITSRYFWGFLGFGVLTIASFALGVYGWFTLQDIQTQQVIQRQQVDSLAHQVQTLLLQTQ